jgi:hypothetical protein
MGRSAEGDAVAVCVSTPLLMGAWRYQTQRSRQCETGLGRTHRLARNLTRPNVIYPQRAGYILDALLASILEGKIELVAHLVNTRPD